MRLRGADLALVAGAAAALRAHRLALTMTVGAPPPRDHGRVSDDRWLRVTSSCRIDRRELQWLVSRSGGPGGQHANTSDTRVEVRFDVEGSASLGPRQRSRLLERLGPVVRASAADSRSQARNRELALDRLCDRIARALAVERPRRPTRPSRSARAARVEQKRQRSRQKQQRRRPTLED